MKNLLLTALLASGVLLQAQSGDRARNHDLSAEQLATLKTKKLTLALDLSEAQQTEIQTLIEDKARLRIENKEDHEKKPLSPEEKYNRQIARLDKAIEHKAQMKDILSEAQYAKWERLQLKKAKGDKGRQMKRRAKHADKRR